MKSLREWAREKRIWELGAWREFLENDIVPFYSLTYRLNEFNNFLHKFEGKPIVDVEEEIREKVRVCLYGGIGPGQDVDRSFAKFMFDYFGMCAQGASTLDESIQSYELFGDEVKINLRRGSWIASVQIYDLLRLLDNIIEWQLCQKLGIELEAVGLRRDITVFPRPVEHTEKPDELLPSPGEEPKELLSLVNDFRQKALNLSVGVNPFMTFMFYVRAIPRKVLQEFLECDLGALEELTNFLGLKAHYMMDLKEIEGRTESKLVMLWQGDRSLISKFLELHSFLAGVKMLKVAEIFERAVREASYRIQISFPWDKYKPFFVSVASYIDPQRSDFIVKIDNGKIVEVNNGYSRGYSKFSSTPLDLSLSDFLMRLSPLICSGMIDIITFGPLEIHFRSKFPHIAKEWIEGVIQNEGKA